MNIRRAKGNLISSTTGLALVILPWLTHFITNPLSYCILPFIMYFSFPFLVLFGWLFPRLFPLLDYLYILPSPCHNYQFTPRSCPFPLAFSTTTWTIVPTTYSWLFFLPTLRIQNKVPNNSLTIYLWIG